MQINNLQTPYVGDGRTAIKKKESSVAAKKAEGPDGVDKDLTHDVDASLEAGEALDDATQGIADVPSGDELTGQELDAPEPFEVIDDEAEELSGGDDSDSILALFKGLDDYDQVDDEDEEDLDDDVVESTDDKGDYNKDGIDAEQLEQAEDDAMDMESTKPVPIERPKKKDKSSQVSTTATLTAGAETVKAATAKKNRPTRTLA